MLVMRKRHDSLLALVIELLLTIGISIIIVINSINVVAEEADKYVKDVDYNYEMLTNSYKSVFSALIIPVEEKLATDPSFAEMDSWLKANDSTFKGAVGAEVYDGFSMSYKGGYAHSWNYGNYSGYDATTRPWYKGAQKAAGKVAVIAPYVSFLGETGDAISEDAYIELSIVKKYSKTVSFDLDIKLSQLDDIVEDRTTTYDSSAAILYDKNGYILSSTDEDLYAHNLNKPDKHVSKSLQKGLRKAENRPK